MAKLRQTREKTDIPLSTRIKLWRIIADYPAYELWIQGIANNSTKFGKNEDQYISLSRHAYKLLQKELQEMPLSVVTKLPVDLKEWVLNIRPDLKVQSQTSLEQQSENIKTNTSLLGHFSGMAGIARTLAFRQQFLIDNHSWLWCNGVPYYTGTIDQGIKIAGAPMAKYKEKLLTPTDYNLSKQLLLHFNWQFPNLAFKAYFKISDGKEQEIADKLKAFGSVKSYTLCPSCPVCQAINEL